jgi:predicted O-linked N-acetylglucosamine transferase (SPINDLY family)
LRAVGLPELVTGSVGEYEAKALWLAREPEAMAEVRAKLAANRGTSALFDAGRFARHLEAAYVTMWERAERGEPPQGFTVAPLA